MKNIKSFKGFFINENIETKEEMKKPTFVEDSSIFLLKNLLRELKTNIVYWFNYGDIINLLTLVDIELYDSKLMIVALEKNEDGKPVLMWKIDFTESKIEGSLLQVKKLKMNLRVYSYDTNNLVKSLIINVPINYLNEDYLIKKINTVKKSIIQAPETTKDIKKFKRKETRRLKDNIY
jgi:hypothetical protein